MTAAADIEAIERATLAAVSPPAVEQFGDWLLPFDSGSIGRAKSAVPLRHEHCESSVVDAIEARYRSRGLAAAFRVPDNEKLEAVRDELVRRDYHIEQPTVVHIGRCEAMLRVSGETPADVAASPDEAWASVFVGEGFDPVDGAYRVKALSRSTDALYAGVRDAGRTVAVGVAAFGYGWASVHGMRTNFAQRGKGFAGRVLIALAQAALDRGIARVFLQVEENNAPAISLYRRAGFEPAWRYVYWRKG